MNFRPKESGHFSFVLVYQLSTCEYWNIDRVTNNIAFEGGMDEILIFSFSLVSTLKVWGEKNLKWQKYIKGSLCYVSYVRIYVCRRLFRVSYVPKNVFVISIIDISLGSISGSKQKSCKCYQFQIHELKWWILRNVIYGSFITTNIIIWDQFQCKLGKTWQKILYS